MPANRLYHTWVVQIRQLCPHGRKTLIRNFTWLLVGIYLSRKVHLSEIANKIPGRAKLNSTVQRLCRLLQNRGLCVRKWYDPVAQELLQRQALHGGVCLIVDGSKVSFHHRLLMVAIAYRRRAVPVAWTWVHSKQGHSSALKQLALLHHVQRWVPAGVPVSVVGDSEFGSGAVLKQLDRWQWAYVLRQRSSVAVDLTLHNHWQSFGDYARRGESHWLGQGFLTLDHVHRTHLLAHWSANEPEPWLLATSASSRQEALRMYRRRMWIEELFGDLKGHGFNLEDSHLRHFLRLSRLTLAVVLLYVWLLACGSRVIKNGCRSLVDRTDRRDLSLFRLGYNMIERRLTNEQSFSVTFALHL